MTFVFVPPPPNGTRLVCEAKLCVFCGVKYCDVFCLLLLFNNNLYKKEKIRIKNTGTIIYIMFKNISNSISFEFKLRLIMFRLLSVIIT